MGLKPGYKHTEVGVIPEEWKIEPIEQIAGVGRGRVISHREIDRSFSPLYPVYSSQTSNNGVMGYLDTFEFEGEYITWTTDGANAGTVFYRNGRFNCTNVCGTIKLKSDNHLFVAKVLGEIAPRHVSRQLGNPKLMNDVMKSIKIPLPPTREEQKAIAEALSDADALINSLEQLLSKKRDLKQGAMQELLTGKKRLPGFSDRWEPRVFGEIVQPRKQRVDPRISGPHEFCIELEHIEQGTGHLAGYAATSEESSLKSVFQKNDVLFGKLRAYLRKYWLADCEGVCSTEIWVLIANLSFLTPSFLFQIVKMDRFIDAASEAYGTHMPRSDWNVVKNYEVLLPPIEEQIAIAAALYDMDTEIAALETKLTKARKLKTGMMQELLTGRIRLVRSSASVVPFVVVQQADVNLNKSHNPQINEAVVIAVLASRFGTKQYPLARVRRTKLTYLLHRHVEHAAKGFLKKAAGPYNPATRYGGPEKIALNNRYVRSHNNGKYEGFVAADNIAQAIGYFEKWYGSPVLEWMEQFRRKPTEELELLSTVDMASEDLRNEGKAVSLSAVKQVLRSNSEWKAKLDRPVFSDSKIAAAIQLCHQLFASEGETV
jgi:type I restriction enzyme S subunit